MKLDQVRPNAEQIAALQNYPKDEPVTMVNILRFKEKIEGRSESGAAAYSRYAQNIVPLLQKARAEIIWRGKVKHIIIGDTVKQPHLIFMVKYPCITDFFGMITSEAYQKIANDRTIALEYGGLIACGDVEGF